jgi:hypothetical protein
MHAHGVLQGITGLEARQWLTLCFTTSPSSSPRLRLGPGLRRPTAWLPFSMGPSPQKPGPSRAGTSLDEIMKVNARPKDGTQGGWAARVGAVSFKS